MTGEKERSKADNTERAVQELAGKLNGRRKTVNDLYAVLLAVNQDGEERHGETLELLSMHCAEDDLRDDRVAALEAWRRDHSSSDIERTVAIVKLETEARHAEHMAADHQPLQPHGPTTSADLNDQHNVGVALKLAEVSFRVKVIWGTIAAAGFAALTFLVNFAMDAWLHP
jgi:hypothetical protein